MRRVSFAIAAMVLVAPVGLAEAGPVTAILKALGKLGGKGGSAAAKGATKAGAAGAIGAGAADDVARAAGKVGDDVVELGDDVARHADDTGAYVGDAVDVGSAAVDVATSGEEEDDDASSMCSCAYPGAHGLPPLLALFLLALVLAPNREPVRQEIPRRRG